MTLTQEGLVGIGVGILAVAGLVWIHRQPAPGDPAADTTNAATSAGAGVLGSGIGLSILQALTGSDASTSLSVQQGQDTLAHVVTYSDSATSGVATPASHSSAFHASPVGTV